MGTRRGLEDGPDLGGRIVQRVQPSKLVLDSMHGGREIVADRTTLLGRLVVGDIIQADGPNGACPLCLVYEITATVIRARSVNTQKHYEFDRVTGIGDWRDGSAVTINSVAPFPVEIHNIILGLDRKYRLLRDIKEAALTDDEIRAMLFAADHHEANPLGP
jgi:hypothetical protein